MGALVKLIDVLLFISLLAIAFKIPFIRGQACLPITWYPDCLVELRTWYAAEVGDYLITETPDFYVGIVWVELLLQWPLVLVNLYGILAGKHWFNCTCLCYGISLFTAMVPIFAELTRSGRATDNLLTVSYSFLGLGVVAILRGLFPHSSSTKFSSTNIIGKRPAYGQKKRD